METAEPTLLEVHQDLLESAAKIGTVDEVSSNLIEQAAEEEQRARTLYTERSWADVELVEEERMRAQEHMHWLRAAQFRWLSMNPDNRTGTYGSIKFHRFLATKWLRLSDLRWMAEGLHGMNASGLTEAEWYEVYHGLTDVREKLLIMETTGDGDHELLRLHVGVIEKLLDKCG